MLLEILRTWYFVLQRKCHYNVVERICLTNCQLMG